MFLSSTFRDLKKERKRVRKIADEVCNVIGMEKFLPDEKCVLKTCLENLRKCDIYVGIIGSSYGSIIPYEQLVEVEGEKAEDYKGLSFTHYEFRKAGELGIPRAVFIMGDSEANIEDRAMGFRREIEDSISPVWFGDLDELGGKVGRFLREQIPRWVCEGTVKLLGFYGRRGVLKELYDKIVDEREICSTVNVCGVGGIGKTALVEALLLLLSIRGYQVWEIRRVGGRETTFSVPQNYRSEVLRVADISGLAEVLDVRVRGEDATDALLTWIDENYVVLFIDEFQDLENNFKGFINKAYANLRFGKVIVASRKRAKGKYHYVEVLGRLKEKPCRELIINELRNTDVEPTERVVDLVLGKTKGHPLAVKMFVPLIARRVLSLDELERFGSIGNVKNEDEVKDFVSRVFEQNVKDKREREVLMYLSVLRGGFDFDILRAVFKEFGDKRCDWEDEKLHREFLSQLTSHIIDYGIFFPFEFSHDMVREAAFSILGGKVVEARKMIIEHLKSREAHPVIYAEIIYQAERLLETVKEPEGRKQYLNDILNHARPLSEVGYKEGFAWLSVHYGRKAFEAALKLEKPIEALAAAENILFYAEYLQLTKIAEETAEKLDEIYKEALKMDGNKARYYYGGAMLAWAIYQLNVLRKTPESEKIVQKVKKVIGEPQKPLIKPPLNWFRIYYRGLEIEFDIARQKGRHEKAGRLLSEQGKLLNKFKKTIIDKYGEESYYHGISLLENRKANFMYDMGKLKKAYKASTNAIKFALKAGKRSIAAGLRVNLALTDLLLARNDGDFKEIVKKSVKGLTLEEAFKESEDISAKSTSKQIMALASLAQGKLQDSLEEAEEAYNLSLKGADPYLIAKRKLVFKCIKMLKTKDFAENEVKDIIDRFQRLRSANILYARVALKLTFFILNKMELTELLKTVDEIIKKIKRPIDKKMLNELKRELHAYKTLSEGEGFASEEVRDPMERMKNTKFRIWLAKILAIT